MRVKFIFKQTLIWYFIFYTYIFELFSENIIVTYITEEKLSLITDKFNFETFVKVDVRQWYYSWEVFTIVINRGLSDNHH